MIDVNFCRSFLVKNAILPLFYVSLKVFGGIFALLLSRNRQC